ncbi:WhiB transcription factor [Mycobacterium phage RitSun]|uniref:WhiB family transcription factor n=2 Tax=Gracegardnervirinae TaxID=2946632 RepID=Q855P8_9CAUD|nr:WhiB family transcription factor [Mycobacterium phage Che9d]YP_009856238.1 WhiB family transcription factor [Mycobacterium phage Cornie]AAN07983.1 WhiB family transcription factor [Mycobacterium phage Che9d]QIG58427.1 WhiB family transcription factor [Mycobacterium phage Cornie]QXG07441.1 WhiB transcription factor [Mycobacterium phage RitSun]
MANSPFIQLAEVHTDDWRRKALCTHEDGDIWFLNESGHYVNDAARKICWECPVQPQCLQWALKHNELGVWGGFSEKERQRIKRGELAPVKPARFTDKKCEQCGDVFEPVTQRARFCSPKCKKRAANALRSVPSRKTCSHCGGEFMGTYAQTCSNECRRAQRWGA